MKDEEKVLELLKKNNGVIKTAELKKLKVSRMALTRLVEKSLIERVAKGLYIDINNIEDTYYTFQYKCPKAIFSHETALYFHDLTDRTPIKFMVTVPSGYYSKHLKDKEYEFSYIKDELYELGRIKVKTPFQNEVYCYDMERTICDIVRNKSKIEVYQFTDAMQRYVKMKNKQSHKLYEYAEKLNIKEEVRKYMEVLV